MSLHTDFYVGDRACTWAEIRGYLLEAHPSCSECGEPADEIDHIWPRYFGGDDWSGNLRSICGTCNRAKGYRVDLDAADTSQLRVAVSACVARSLKCAAEADPFLEGLAARSERLPLLAAREGLAALRDQLACRIALADAALARLEAA